MKREMGIARCGLACCLCSQNDTCPGCGNDACKDRDWCENRKCSLKKGLAGCFDCTENCKKGLLGKVKPQALILFLRRYGKEMLLDCLERNEKNGVVYHRDGIAGDYDDFTDAAELMKFIWNGKGE